MPKEIFQRNPKMEKTDTGGFQYTVNTGLPALRGVLYDQENKKFFIINTCPGACAVSCYARKGWYIMNDGKNLKYIQRLNLLMNNPELYESMVMDELEPICYKETRLAKKEVSTLKLS